MAGGATGAEAERVAQARRWFRRQGLTAVERDGVTAVVTPAHPSTWDVNFVTAEPDVRAEAVLAALDREFAHGPWRVVQVDCLTEPAVEAALALAGFAVKNTLIEMMAREVASPHPVPAVALQAVGEAEWATFAALVDADMREGKRTGEHDEAVAAGLLDGMRRRMETCRYWLLVEGGAALGYGMTVRCRNGLGLIENLFTLPGHRGRGLMSGFIVEAARRLAAEGCDAVFLDAQVHDTPKRLYASLGFEPVALTRIWVRRA